jgi:flagellar hook-length control protein FliK
MTQAPTQTVDAAPLTRGADELALRLTTTDFLRGTFVPGAGTEFVADQLAAFAASQDGGRGSPGTPPLTGPGGPDTASTALLSRLGSTTLPALQPLAGNPSFAGGLADRLLTLGGPGAHTARLKLHPEHLGELDVEIQIDDGSAQVWFGTTTSQAREAIEASLPRLKELFADQGLALTRTQVDGGGNGQPGSQNSDQQRRMAAGRPVEADLPWRTAPRVASSPLAGLLPATRPSTRLVDAWA